MGKKKDYKGEMEIEGEMEKNYNNKLLLFPFFQLFHFSLLTQLQMSKVLPLFE